MVTVCWWQCCLLGSNTPLLFSYPHHSDQANLATEAQKGIGAFKDTQQTGKGAEASGPAHCIVSSRLLALEFATISQSLPLCVLTRELTKLSHSPGCTGWNLGLGGSSCLPPASHRLSSEDKKGPEVGSVADRDGP